MHTCKGAAFTTSDHVSSQGLYGHGQLPSCMVPALLLGWLYSTPLVRTILNVLMSRTSCELCHTTDAYASRADVFCAPSIGESFIA